MYNMFSTLFSTSWGLAGVSNVTVHENMPSFVLYFGDICLIKCAMLFAATEYYNVHLYFYKQLQTLVWSYALKCCGSLLHLNSSLSATWSTNNTSLLHTPHISTSCSNMQHIEWPEEHGLGLSVKIQLQIALFIGA